MAKRKRSTFERLRDGKMNRQERREWQQRLCGEDTGLEVVHPDAAGIDVGTRVILWRCRRTGMSNPCGSLDRGQRICGVWRSG
jgi:hypothetical protein